MVGSCGSGLLGLRDRTLLLVGFAAALRRSEIVALDVSDAIIGPEGARPRIRRSKTDEEGAGELVGIVRTDTAGSAPRSPTSPSR